jgi:putative ABC transport system permease protein
MTVGENIKVALNSIRGNALRTTITSLIISIGIMALVGILTAIDGIKGSINENFSNMGSNSFNIKNRASNIHFGGRRKKNKGYRSINFAEAREFKRKFSYPAITSISVNASFASQIRAGSEKTNPNNMIMGGDEKYLLAAGYSLANGRNFTAAEVQFGNRVVLLGAEVKSRLFKNRNAEGEIVSIGGIKFKVIGVLGEKGASMGFGGDRIAIIPLQTARQIFPNPNMSFVITVVVNHVQEMEAAIGEATGLFRNIRKIHFHDEENFEIMKSDSLANMVIENISYVTLASTFIGFITLLGAAIGLMNIMLVSVTERTREIGVRKALGATAFNIRSQFLVESLVICQIGGVGGVILGILIGNGVSLIVGGAFIIPWFWIISGLLLCFLVGLVSGIYPAIKASKLDPIEALRFE